MRHEAPRWALGEGLCSGGVQAQGLRMAGAVGRSSRHPLRDALMRVHAACDAPDETETLHAHSALHLLQLPSFQPIDYPLHTVM